MMPGVLADKAYVKTVSYMFFFLLLYAMSRTLVGYKIIYYSLVLIAVFLLLSNAGNVVELLKPATQGEK